MALDGAFLYCLRAELTELIGARVDKIHQPSRDELVVVLRSRGGAHRLLLSANAQSARVQLTEITLENPKQPPMLCMLLRKHLSGGKLVEIRQEGLERILHFDFECMNELGDMGIVTLACEIMGRHSNVIAIGRDGRIIDAVKRVDGEMSSVRRVLPGMAYTLPPREERLNLLTCTDEEILAAMEAARNDKLHKCLIRIFEGISPIFARECAMYAARDMDTPKSELTQDAMTRLLFHLKQARDALLHKPIYTMVMERSGKPKDFSFVDITQYGNVMLTRRYDSACVLLEDFFAERDRIDRMRQRSHDLLKLLVNATERVQRRTESQRMELAKSRDRERLKVFGDLLNANIYRLEKGQTKAVLENFYEPEAPQVEIPLDVRLTPAQNAQRYYTEYHKADTAERKLREQIAQSEQELLYLDSVFDAVTRTQGESELLEIREELAEQGYLRRQKRANKMLRAQPPLRYTSSDGFAILVGRNNKQNDKLTLKDAKATDLWLHTKDIPGSHVIIACEGETPPEETIMEAAVLAAVHSKARESAQVPVDYTQVRYVKKPHGAKPGMVIFTHNKTLYVTPDTALADRLSDIQQKQNTRKERIER